MALKRAHRVVGSWQAMQKMGGCRCKADLCFLVQPGVPRTRGNVGSEIG